MLRFLPSVRRTERPLRRRARRALAAAALAVSICVCAAPPAPAPVSRELPYARLYAGADGVSRFSSGKLVLAGAPGAAGPAAAMPVSVVGEARDVTFAYLAPGATEEWHVVPYRMLLVCVQGTVEITAGDGSRRRLTPGEVLVAEDTTGKGHVTQVVGSAGHVALVMALPPGWPAP